MDPITPSDGGTRNQHLAVGALAAALVALGIFTLWHFLSALAWAGILSIALWPLYRRAQARFGGFQHEAVLPALFTLAVGLVFIVPLGLVGVELAREAHGAADWLRGVQEHGLPEPGLLHHLPIGQSALDGWWQQNLADPGSAGELVQRSTHGKVANAGREIGAAVARRVTLFVFTLLTLFFLFKDGHELTQQMRRGAARAFGPRGQRVGLQIIASVHGTVSGLVLVGLGEGLLLGLIYALTGVPHATVFGALTAVAAMIPFAAPVVFGLAALLLLAKGSIGSAVLVLVAGFATTFIADHFIRPVLIGGATRLPFIWVLLGILGGVEMWGLLGLFVGPAIMAALILLWREFVGNAAVAGAARGPGAVSPVNQ
jgi:predicted PurR-regulated permease PerM